MKIKIISSLVLVVISLVSCNTEKKYHTYQQEKTYVEDSTLTSFELEIQQFQNELNNEFSNPESSPLYDRHRARFTGLDFFKPDENFRVTATLTTTPNTTPFMMPTTNPAVEKQERVYGIVEFELFSKTYQLEVYQSTELMQTEAYADYLFLPFTDLTNGATTYGGGRYLDLRIPESNQIVIDFNKAYNPFCAYNVNYSCPKVPKVNHLELEITAGVKKFNQKKATE